MKKLLLKNAKETMKNILAERISDNNEEMDKENSNFILEAKEKGNTNLNLELQNKDFDRKKLSKKNYHFPDYLNLGNLVNYNYIPSKIVKDEAYKTVIPFLLPFSNNGFAFFMNSKYKSRIIDILELSAIKVLNSLPDGLARVSLIDKTGAGQNFPYLSRLHEKFINGKVLTEESEIELELENLKNSMATISQSISANGFTSIEEYNKNTDEIAQPYSIVLVSNFPTGFNKRSSENLLSLVESGPSAGIFVIMSISLDPTFGNNQNIHGLTLGDFLKHTPTFEITDRIHDYVNKGYVSDNVELYSFPFVEEKEFKKFVNNVYAIDLEKTNPDYMQQSIEELNANIEKIELRPIIDITKMFPEKFWTKDAGLGVSVPFGKRGIESIYFSLGINQYGEDESTHHCLIGGSTGSGKTVFIHDLILQMTMNYSPSELMLYLLDYKEGTEFAVYKDYPAVKILSMESEVEFGQEVLEQAIKLMEERGTLFKEVGVSRLADYNNKVSEDKKLPRIIIIIDEFQALLPANQKVANKTNTLLDRILRLGRSFGINLIFSTQTLKGIDLDPAILSNIPLRIGLKMDEKDAAKLFAEGNHAPKFLKYPGEGIYNKSYGTSIYNVNFQAFRALGEVVESTIKMISDYTKKELEPSLYKKIMNERFVYSGEKKAVMDFSKIDSNSDKIYIGEPVGLSKEDISFKFNSEYGDNLLIVGSEFEKAYFIIYSMLLQQSKSDIYFFNYSSQVNFRDKVDNGINFFNNKNAEEGFDKVYKIFKDRQEQYSKNEGQKFNSIFIYHYFLESSKLFSTEGARNANMKKLLELLSEGSELGIHSIYYSSDFATISSLDISRELSKFKKKIALKGGNSLKIFPIESSISFSDSDLISIINIGDIQKSEFKFKPYLEVIGEYNEK
jgi:hypothetical protein